MFCNSNLTFRRRGSWTWSWCTGRHSTPPPPPWGPIWAAETWTSSVDASPRDRPCGWTGRSRRDHRSRARSRGSQPQNRRPRIEKQKLDNQSSGSPVAFMLEERGSQFLLSWKVRNRNGESSRRNRLETFDTESQLSGGSFLLPTVGFFLRSESYLKQNTIFKLFERKCHEGMATFANSPVFANHTMLSLLVTRLYKVVIQIFKVTRCIYSMFCTMPCALLRMYIARLN